MGARPDQTTANRTFLNTIRRGRCSAIYMSSSRTRRRDHHFGRLIHHTKALTVNFTTTQAVFRLPLQFPLKFSKTFSQRQNVKTSADPIESAKTSPRCLFGRSIRQTKALTVHLRTLLKYP